MSCYGMNVSVRQKVLCWNPNTKVAWRKKVSEKKLRLNDIIRMRPLSYTISVLIRKDTRKLVLSPSLLLHMTRKGHLQARRECSPETEAARNLTVDFWAPELRDYKLLLLSHSACGTSLWQPKQTKTCPEGLHWRKGANKLRDVKRLWSVHRIYFLATATRCSSFLSAAPKQGRYTGSSTQPLHLHSSDVAAEQKSMKVTQASRSCVLSQNSGHTPSKTQFQRQQIFHENIFNLI